MNSPTFRLRAVLGTVTGVLLVLCLAAAWVFPRPTPAPATEKHVAEHRCDTIVGPAHIYCRQTTLGTSEPVAAPRRAGTEQSGWLLLFSSAAITGAIGLSLTAGRGRR
ncbi:hypothetical protein ABZY19_30290 [Streptomyces sp. NPDC006475]|uniref:hypothetical protein n=1 Tax=Streptomyces sp. NPDC006475 TaxID=3155719 RepID=UPI0033B46631